MSPILLRPIREQFEHDRVIRQLQTRWRRKYDVGTNLGGEEETPVRVGPRTVFPDLVLTGTTPRRLHGVVEVETAESVNHLEAKAEWAHFARVRGAFYLYVPAGFTDVAERLCHDGNIRVSEIWAYYAIGSQVKFSLSYRSPQEKSRRDRASASRGSDGVGGADGKRVRTSARATRTAKTARPSKSAKTVRAPRIAKKTARGTRRAAAKTTATRPAKAKKAAGTRKAVRGASARVGKLAKRKK